MGVIVSEEPIRKFAVPFFNRFIGFRFKAETRAFIRNMVHMVNGVLVIGFIQQDSSVMNVERISENIIDKVSSSCKAQREIRLILDAGILTERGFAFEVDDAVGI